MTKRQKQGIGFFASGGVMLVAGYVYTFLSANPTWWAGALAFVGLVAGFFGFKIALPNTEE